MKSKERRNQPPEGFVIAQAHIPVVGLLPAVHDTRTGKVVRESNLAERLPELHDAIDKNPWFYKLLKDVQSGRKSAVVKVALGGIFITAAIGAGYEFGIRHGKDLKEFSEILKRKPISNPPPGE